MKILVIEDEKTLGTLVVNALNRGGFEATLIGRGDKGLDEARSGNYSAIVLDKMLPGIDGFEVLRSLRAEANPVSVLMLTARDEVENRIAGLELGADDYMGKPFDVDELVARVRALTRRTTGTATSVQIGDLHVDFLRRKVNRGADKLDLTPREFALLECLALTPGQALSRLQLIEKVWGYHFDPGTNIVDVHIQHVRKKVDEPYEKKLIHTVRGVGYKIEDMG